MTTVQIHKAKPRPENPYTGLIIAWRHDYREGVKLMPGIEIMVEGEFEGREPEYWMIMPDPMGDERTKPKRQ